MSNDGRNNRWIQIGSRSLWAALLCLALGPAPEMQGQGLVDLLKRVIDGPQARQAEEVEVQEEVFVEVELEEGQDLLEPDRVLQLIQDEAKLQLAYVVVEATRTVPHREIQHDQRVRKHREDLKRQLRFRFKLQPTRMQYLLGYTHQPVLTSALTDQDRELVDPPDPNRQQHHWIHYQSIHRNWMHHANGQRQFYYHSAQITASVPYGELLPARIARLAGGVRVLGAGHVVREEIPLDQIQADMDAIDLPGGLRFSASRWQLNNRHLNYQVRCEPAGGGHFHGGIGPNQPLPQAIPRRIEIVDAEGKALAEMGHFGHLSNRINAGGTETLAGDAEPVAVRITIAKGIRELVIPFDLTDIEVPLPETGLGLN